MYREKLKCSEGLMHSVWTAWCLVTNSNSQIFVCTASPFYKAYVTCNSIWDDIPGCKCILQNRSGAAANRANTHGSHRAEWWEMFSLLIYTCKLDQVLVSINQYSLMNSLGGIQIWKAELVRKKTVCALVEMGFSNHVLELGGCFVGRGLSSPNSLSFMVSILFLGMPAFLFFLIPLPWALPSFSRGVAVWASTGGIFWRCLCIVIYFATLPFPFLQHMLAAGWLQAMWACHSCPFLSSAFSELSSTNLNHHSCLKSFQWQRLNGGIIFWTIREIFAQLIFIILVST